MRIRLSLDESKRENENIMNLELKSERVRDCIASPRCKRSNDNTPAIFITHSNKPSFGFCFTKSSETQPQLSKFCIVDSSKTTSCKRKTNLIKQTTKNINIMANNANNATSNNANDIMTYKSGDTYEVKERTIISVMRGRTEDGQGNRYYIELDGDSFPAFDKNGEETQSNSFSMALLTLAKQIATKHELFNMAFAMANAARATLNPALVGLLLQGCKITVTRTFKDATDLRDTDNDNDTYGKDTWVNTITDIKPNIGALSQQIIINMIMNPDTLTIKEAPKAPTLDSLLNIK